MSNEVRLIDANALKNYIDCGHLRPPTEKCFSELDVVRMLDKQPTIDAVPVVHGHYCFVGQGLQNVQVVLGTCSECSRRIAMYVPTWHECNHYCPNCGAKMDAKDVLNDDHV